MANIKLIVSVPEEIYKASQIIDVKYEDTVQIPLEIITNSIPLPKNNGRLLILSENRLKENLMNLDFSCQKWIGEVDLCNSTVAIIEADKEDEDG